MPNMCGHTLCFPLLLLALPNKLENKLQYAVITNAGKRGENFKIVLDL